MNTKELHSIKTISSLILSRHYPCGRERLSKRFFLDGDVWRVNSSNENAAWCSTQDGRRSHPDHKSKTFPKDLCVLAVDTPCELELRAYRFIDPTFIALMKLTRGERQLLGLPEPAIPNAQAATPALN